MRGIRVDNDGLPTRGMVVVNKDHVWDDRGVVKNGVAADGHGISDEGELRTNEEENDGRMDLLQAQTILHAQQQQQLQPQGPVVLWERFLPLKSLKVLLVENDDSTRHVVSALLQNCSYEAYGSVSCLCQSSGSGSESGMRTQKSTELKSVEGSDNNTDSNDDEDDIGSIGLNYSDNGSGTRQSSWSKRAVEVESPQPMSPWEDSADHPDSTCALVIHSKPEAHSSNWAPTNATRKAHKQNDESDNISMGKDLRIGLARDPDLQIEIPRDEEMGNVVSTEKGKFSDSHVKKDREKLDKYHNMMTNDKLQDKHNYLMGAITSITMAHGGSAHNETPNEACKITTLKDMDPYNTKELPSLELSFKRLRHAGDTGNISQELNILRHSDHSTLSRHNTASTTNQAPTRIVGSCSPVNDSSEAAKTESMLNLQSNSSDTPNQGSNGSRNYNDMGSTTNKVFTKSEVLCEKPTSKSTVNTRPSSAFQPVQHGHNSFLQPMTGKPDASKTIAPQARTTHQQTQVEHHHHHHYHHHHHHHHVHSLQQQQQLLNGDDLTLRNMIAGAPQCGPSKMLSVAIEGNAANYGSASGSNNGSNGQNGSSGQYGSSTAVVMEGTNLASDNGGTGKCGTGGSIANGIRCGADQDRLAQREAALNKFCQKRKERCFEKKVRYQSRKKLAEQRPRVRRQFVRQIADENKGKDASKDTDC